MTMNFIADPKTIFAPFYKFQKLKTKKKKFKNRTFGSNFVKIWFFMIFEFYKISSKLSEDDHKNRQNLSLNI